MTQGLKIGFLQFSFFRCQNSFDQIKTIAQGFGKEIDNQTTVPVFDCANDKGLCFDQDFECLDDALS